MRRACLILTLVALFAGASFAGHALSSPVEVTGTGNFYVLGDMDVDGTVLIDGVATFNANAIFTLDVSVGVDLTVTGDATISGLIYGRQPAAQYYHATATDTVYDLNVSTAVPLKWGTETLEDTGYTHGTTSLKTRCILDAAGWYRVTYSVTTINNTGNRRLIKCYARLNGTTTVTPSVSYGHSRNDVVEYATGTATFLVQTSAADEYLEVMGLGVGEVIDTETANTVLDECWVLIERLF